VHGVIIEFGVRWGQNLSILQSLRSIHEPYNHNRKILGFDTFEGFKSINIKDGKNDIIAEGALAVSDNYYEFLNNILRTLEYQSPLSEIQKFKLIKGDATISVKKYFEDHPETIVSIAYFDFDLNEPTKKALEIILMHTVKGSIICFDELNCEDFPG